MVSEFDSAGKASVRHVLLCDLMGGLCLLHQSLNGANGERYPGTRGCGIRQTIRQVADVEFTFIFAGNL